jgi:hypothetical protein
MGQDYHFENGEEIPAPPTYFGLDIPDHPKYLGWGGEGEEYRAGDLEEWSEEVILWIRRHPKYNLYIRQMIDCWGDPIPSTFENDDIEFSRGLLEGSSEMKEWAKKQEWYISAALNSLFVGIAQLNECCRNVDPDSSVYLD